MANDSGFGTASVAAAVLLAACSGTQTRREGAEDDLSALADRYFDEVIFKYSPTRATRAGLHQYDARLEDPSRAAVDAQVAALQDFERRLDAVKGAPGSTEAVDRELLLSAVRGPLREATTGRGAGTDPRGYSGA